MNYNETIDYLYSRLPMFHRLGKAAYKADLSNTIYLDNYFGNPHRNYKTIHIAGTNGKGSVSSSIASVLTEAGFKTGLYTSPHLIDYRERIRINGEMIPEQEVIDFVEKSMAIIDEIKPSFFELTTALAFNYFAKSGVDIAVIETGMGGRLDCTNIISPILSVITNIGLDHTEFLGDSLEEIAAEKAGIIKESVPVVIGEHCKSTDLVFIAKAMEKNAGIYFAQDSINAKFSSSDKGYFSFNIKTSESEINGIFPYSGKYQFKNIITAVSALNELQHQILIQKTNIEAGLKNIYKNTGLRGRWEIISTNPYVICDTGHNAHGFTYITEQIKTINASNTYMVFGMVNDKDIKTVLNILPKNANYIFTKASVPRAMNADALALNAGYEGLKGIVIPKVSEAIEYAKARAQVNDLIFIGGSTFVVADALAYFEGKNKVF